MSGFKRAICPEMVSRMAIEDLIYEPHSNLALVSPETLPVELHCNDYSSLNPVSSGGGKVTGGKSGTTGVFSSPCSCCGGGCCG